MSQAIAMLPAEHAGTRQKGILRRLFSHAGAAGKKMKSGIEFVNKKGLRAAFMKVAPPLGSAVLTAATVYGTKIGTGLCSLNP